MVVRLFLLRIVFVLHPAAYTGSDGCRERFRNDSFSVFGHIRSNTGHVTHVWVDCIEISQASFPAVGLSVLRDQYPDFLVPFLVISGQRQRRSLAWPRLLRMAQRIQPVRRIRFLELHGRRLHP